MHEAIKNRKKVGKEEEEDKKENKKED